MTETTLEQNAGSSESYVDSLQQAALAFRQRVSNSPAPRASRPAPEAVTAALLQAETTAKRQRLTLPFQSLQGDWRLCFTTGVQKRKSGGVKLRSGFYLPPMVPASIAFFPDNDSSDLGTINNQIALAGTRLKLSGRCRYPGKKNLVAFDFMEIEVRTLGVPLYRGLLPGGAAKLEGFAEQAIAQLPFFAFFAATPDYIAARGRGGGLALWVKVQDTETDVTTQPT
ncbi:MAG: hypothetical protein AAFX78_14290 [Cyanobacteria bacterium J06638_20]